MNSLSMQPGQNSRAWGRIIAGAVIAACALLVLVAGVVAHGDAELLAETPLAALELPSWVRAAAFAVTLGGAGLAAEGWFRRPDVPEDDLDDPASTQPGP